MKALRCIAIGAMLMAGVVAAGMLVGCGSNAVAQDPALLTAHRWALESYLDADGATAQPVDGSDVGIAFSGADVSGTGGVNGFRGPYEATADGRMKMGPLTATLIAGPPELMAQEKALLDALEAARYYRVGAGSLELLDEDREFVSTFRKGAPAPKLEGTDWLCTGFNNGQEAFVSVVLDTELTALFEDGSISGGAGVNVYRGGYTLDGDALAIEAPFATTKKAGSVEAMDQESGYLAALANVVSYRIEGHTLTLLGEGDLRLVTYTNQR